LLVAGQSIVVIAEFRREDLLLAAQRFPSLDEAIADCALAVATSGKISEAISGPALDADRAALLRPAPDERLALVFGNERTGLAKEEAARCPRILRLPTPGPVDSFNLSHAVAVALTLLSMAPAAAPRAKAETRSSLLKTWDQALAARGFFKATTSAQMEPRLRELLSKMDLSERDTTLMRDMLQCLGGLPR
jgi:tRNA C32,U32 (ribose-2'-O)-methylase TrmJ